ncbi:MAG: tetratricopeptide repeat protein, partial [Endomicrobiia bacterium]
TYLAIGKIDLAEEEFKKAISMDPSFYYSYIALGNLYLKKNEPEKAKKYFDEAVRIYPYLIQE